MTCLDTKIGALTNQQLAEMMIGAPEYIEPVLENLSYEKQTERPWIGLHSTGIWEDFTGDIHKKAQIYFNRGECETDLSRWRPINTSIEAMSEDGSACGGHNPCKKSADEIPGWGFSDVEWGMYERQLKSKEFCIEALRTRDSSMKQILDMFVEYFHEYAENKLEEFVRNHYHRDSQKFILTNKGFEYDRNNPTKYPKIVDITKVATINYGALYKLYIRLNSRLGKQYAAAVINNKPLYWMSISDESLFDSLYHDDKIYKDIMSWTGPQGLPDLIKAFNFTKQYGDMFVTLLDMEVRRFNLKVDGSLEIVPKYLIEIQIPGGQGTIEEENEEWHDATLEELVVFPSNTYKVLSRQKLSSIGGGTLFGTPPVRFENWLWFADRCKGNEWGLTGYWITNAVTGMEPLPGSRHIKSVIFKRAQVRHNVAFLSEPECPPDTGPCAEPTIESVGCPCPVIVEPPFQHPTNPNVWFVKFAPNVTLALEDEIDFELATGGTLGVAGVIDALLPKDSSGQLAEVNFGEEVLLSPDCIIGIVCGKNKVCSSRARVLLNLCNVTGSTITVATIDGVLDVNAGQNVVVNYGDGSQATVALTSFGADGTTVVLPITVASLCAKKDLISICVPTASTATCPGCTADAGYEVCEDSSN